jgi:EmrB/QacA subfamily drug resistance transporter
MTAAISLSMLDATITGVLLPPMERDLHLSQSGTGWVVSAYLLALAVLLPIGGRLGDALGSVRAFQIGIALFVGASIGIAFAPSEGVVIAFRLLQGAGGAIMTPATAVILFDTFPPRSRGRAMAIYSGVGLGFTTVGPLLGGLLAETAGWRWAFLINVPIGVAGLVLASVVRPTTRRTTVPSWDPFGAGLLLVGLGAFVLGLQQGGIWGWTSPITAACVIGGLAALAAFVGWELRQTHPLLQLRLFSRRVFGTSAAVLFGIQFGMVSVTVFGAIWLQNVAGLSSLDAGLALLPLIIPLIISGQVAGRIFDQRGPRQLVTIGSGLTALGLVGTIPGLLMQSYPLLVPAFLSTLRR